MVNIGILKTVVARLCGVVIVAGFLIRPATAMGNNAPATAIKNAVESTANDLTFEGQGPPIPTPPEIMGTASEGKAKHRDRVKDLRDHKSLPIHSKVDAEPGKGFLPVKSTEARHANSLRDIASHPTKEIFHGFDDHNQPSSPPGILARIFNALRSPITSLRPKKIIDPAGPPQTAAATTGGGGGGGGGQEQRVARAVDRSPTGSRSASVSVSPGRPAFLLAWAGPSLRAL
jgi:hypothetical protein